MMCAEDIDKIIATACRIYPASEIRSAMWCARRHEYALWARILGCTYVEIGKRVARDHTTIISGHRTAVAYWAKSAKIYRSDREGALTDKAHFMRCVRADILVSLRRYLPRQDVIEIYRLVKQHVKEPPNGRSINTITDPYRRRF